MSTILITGGTGLVGTRLTQMLVDKGYTVTHLSRTHSNNEQVKTYIWDIGSHMVEDEALQTADYIIHLAGAGIADERWTKERKKVILESRTKSATLLIDRLKELKLQPKAFVSSSAIGYYGDRQHHILNEDDAPGNGFLSEVCVAWEAAVKPVEALGTRLVMLRTGVVLSAQGGALKEMEKPVKFHLGTYLGSGNQYYSWIHIDDLCRMYIAAIENETMRGPYNAAAPNPVRNKILTKAIADALDINAIMLPAPTPALKLALGEMAATVLDSTRVSSNKIEETGFTFEFAEVEKALEDVYERGV